jgi:3-oxoacyl-(acyl-carrier-protein) synthase
VVGRIDSEFTDVFPKKVNSFVSRHTKLGAVAISECIARSGLAEAAVRQTGLLFGSTSHGQDRVKEMVETLGSVPFPEIDYNIVNSISNAGSSSLLAAHFNLQGYVHSIEAASCSAMLSLLTGRMAVRSGLCTRVLCAVGEANLFPATFLFYSRRVRLDGATYTFFGKQRDPEERAPDAFVVPFCSPPISDRGAIAEGGCCILLESLESAQSRGAEILGELEDVEYFFHSDGYHGIDKELTGLKNVLQKYQELSIDSLYLPVTGSYPLDVGLYTMASTIFPKTHAFSVEPIIGHTGAATTLFNVTLALKSLAGKVLLPTRNLRHNDFDPACRLLPSDDPREKRQLSRILVASCGWGGYSGACIIRTYG